MVDRVGRLARRQPEFLVAAMIFAISVVGSSGYGWHSDELYFVVAGQHPAWGYPDQPLFTPLVVGFLNGIGGGSLVAVRLASALGSAATAVVTGIMAGQLGGGSVARLISSLVWGVGAVSLVTGHFVDTTTFDVLATAAVCSCIIAAVARDSGRWLVLAGAILGAGLLNKMLVGFVIAVVVVAMLAVGPRRILLSRYGALASALAIAGAAPYLVWQSLHGWPQVALARSISSSADEGGSLGVIPYQLLLVSPFLAAVWIAGIVRIFRTRDLKRARAFPIAYLLMVALLIASGGKAYYAAGLLPVLVAAGGGAVEHWIRSARASKRLRVAAIATAIVVALAVDAVIGLPVVPARALGSSFVEKVNPDAGLQLGWPALISTVREAYGEIPPSDRATAVIFTSSYGEAGAVDKFGGASGLPEAYSGHNGFAQWGPPTGHGPVIIVGYPVGSVVAFRFRGCRTVGLVDNGLDLSNDEQGAPVLLCGGPVDSWARIWPALIHYG